MKESFPNYYLKFKCIADKCVHNCCIGWEIDIDESTLKFYNHLDTPLGERIRNNIVGDEPYFKLDASDRCPFLNSNNLCDIISECGNEGICQICRLHPRFCNHYDDFTEIGLGLCCEEAARIILAQSDKFSIDIPDNAVLSEEEKEFFKLRSSIFCVLQNRKETIGCRFKKLSEMFGFSFDFSLSELVDFFLSLERLDDNWTHELLKLKTYTFDSSIFDSEFFSLKFEQLSVYFVFRHLYGALEVCDYSERVRFAMISCYLIGALWSYYEDELDDEKMIDIVRMYSSEIEYSEENTEALLYL